MGFNVVNALLNTVLLGLTVFSVSFMLFYTDGPFRLFVLTRMHLSAKFGRDDEGNPVYISERYGGFFTGLFDCFWCFSLWIALGVVTLFAVYISIPFGEALLTLLAVYGLSGYMHERVASG